MQIVEYKFLSLMDQQETKALLIHYGNKTGIEMNNYLARQLIMMKSQGIEHVVLGALDDYVRDCAIADINSRVSEYMDWHKFYVTEKEMIQIIRENKNNLYMLDAIKHHHKSFTGICAKHGRADFSIRGNFEKFFYLCSDCFEEKANSIVYNPIRNFILRNFIKVNSFIVNNVAQELGMNNSYIYRYYRIESPIPDAKWDAISNLIKEINKNG